MTEPHSMTAERWGQLKSLFDQALALEGAERAKFIEQLGVRDPALGQSLRSLVQHHDAAGTLLDGPLISQQRIVEYLTAGVRTFQPGELVANRFQVERFIGEGGMGEVYAAKDLDLSLDVALKTLRPCLLANDQFLERFKLEIQTARLVTHENVCRVFELLWHQPKDGSASIAFLTMELINGETLEERIRRRGRLTERQALPLVRQVAAGLTAAHRAGIVHRDLKSGNILIVEEAGTERARITDFGLARLVKNDSKPGEGRVEGTPAYVAPEQWEGAAATPAADIYALGVVLFEMVTGKLPFSAESLIVDARRQESPPSPRTIVPKLNKRWEGAILSCLEYRPNFRPSTAEAVLEVLGNRRISRRTMALTAAGTFGAMISARFLIHPKALQDEARRSFKRGEDFAQRRNADGLKNAVVEFQRVVKLEPEYAPAWVGLADAYSALGNFDLMEPREAREKSKTAARRAVALDSGSARAQGVYGRILSLDLHDWLSAEPYFQKAVKLDHSDATVRLWYGAYLGKLARPGAAMEQLKAGLEQAPSSMPLNQQLATEFFWERRFPEFRTAAQELVRLQPFESGAHLALARSLEWLTQYDEALRCCDEADRLRSTQTSLCYRASVEVARGNQETGRKMADTIRGYWSSQPFESSLLASLYARLNDEQAAVEILDEGYRREDSTVLTAGCNPYFDAARNGARFQGFLRKIGWTARRT